MTLEAFVDVEVQVAVENRAIIASRVPFEEAPNSILLDHFPKHLTYPQIVLKNLWSSVYCIDKVERAFSDESCDRASSTDTKDLVIWFVSSVDRVQVSSCEWGQKTIVSELFVPDYLHKLCIHGLSEYMISWNTPNHMPSVSLPMTLLIEVTSLLFVLSSLSRFHLICHWHKRIAVIN